MKYVLIHYKYHNCNILTDSVIVYLIQISTSKLIRLLIDINDNNRSIKRRKKLTIYWRLGVAHEFTDKQINNVLHNVFAGKKRTYKAKKIA